MAKLDKDRDVREMSPEALWYDDAILHYRYHRLKEKGERYEGWSAEDFVNLHARIVAELKRRGLPHFDRDDELDRDTAPFLKYAEVRPSGESLGEPISLEDVLPHLRSFKLRQPYLYLVGGLVVHGKTRGDIDILIKDSPDLPPEFRHILEWRILRSLPEHLWGRVQFHLDKFHGPFTDNIPLFDLTVERVNGENRVFRMDLPAAPGAAQAGAGNNPADLVKGLSREEALKFLAWTQEKQAPRAGTPEIARQAEASREEDRVELFRFFVPMKPVRGYFPEERQTVDLFLSLFAPEDFPVHSTKKFDGANYEIHKSGDRVVMFSEDGEENTDRFPGIAAAVRDLPWRDLVLLAEIEMWEGEKHVPREGITGYTHAKGEPDDSNLVANIYDAVFAAGGPKNAGVDPDAGDIHKEAFAEREKYLEALGLAQSTTGAPDLSKKLNRVPSLISRDLDELRRHTEDLASLPGSEGNVAKKAGGAYSLAGRDASQIKYHNSAALAGIVLERIETKVAGTYNYRYGIAPGKEKVKDADIVEVGGEKFLEVGKTFSTNRKAAPGEILEVEFETLNFIRDPDGAVSVTAWAPRVMRILEGRKEPDSVDEAVAAAREGLVFQEKEITPEGETIYLAEGDGAGAPDLPVPEDADFEKANYVGNKRRLAKYIVDKFPEGVKSIADMMCGVGAVLIEAARRGLRVRGNDLSVVPYCYTKGVFEGMALTEEDVEKLKDAPLHDGWLTTAWKGMYPRPRAIRRYLDGLVVRARSFPGGKALAAKAVLSGVLQTMYADSGSGYSTLRYEKASVIKRLIDRSAREVNGLIAEVGGRGVITNENALTARVPRADVIYFDPPFFKRDKGLVLYFNTYRVMNSILLQKEWKEPNLKPEDVPPLLERLCKACRHIFISTSSNEQVPYKKELARHKRAVKRYRVGYSQTSGFGSRDTDQREHLYVAKAENGFEKQVDPYMRLPDEEETHRYVVQEHFRGRSMHADFRIESVGNEELIGWTLNTLIAGAIEEPVTSLAQAKALKPAGHSKIDWATGEFVKRKKEGTEVLVDAEIVCERKAVEPHAWLEIEGTVKPGSVGASKEFPGVFHIVDKGVCEYGAQKPWFHEYFPHSERAEGGFRYRIFLRQLRVAELKPARAEQSEAGGGEEEKALSPALLEAYLGANPHVERQDWDLGYWEFLETKGEIVLPAAETKFRKEAAWLLIKPIDQTPYAISDRAVEQEWIPPKGFSALPGTIREKVPVDYRYWQMERESERRDMRDALVEALASGEIEIPGIEKAIDLDGEFEKRKSVPFNQWGGSSKYAKRLSAKFPAHTKYVEPFAGSAAVLFAKERSDSEVLGDTESEVIFALRYIQRLTPQSFAALKRFPWTVSREGFARVRKAEPRSDAERFWKLVYGRQCTWGGRGNMGGYSTIHDGQTYKLEELWRFKERLQGVRLVNQDWKKTVKDHDGLETLFFLDPPYVEEWGDGGGIPPEEIAEVLTGVKGAFIVAYTDSARARRALSKAGKLFKMRFLEARHAGLWAKRNRLFVASFDMKKAADEWFDLPAAPPSLCKSAAQAGEAAGTVPFVLQYHYFRKRGEKPVREGPTTWHYDLRIDAGGQGLRHWILDHDITKARETVGYYKADPDKRALDAEGFYPPGSFMNPTKDTPAFVEIVDKGECSLLVDQPGLVKVDFKGKRLSGTWLLTRKNSNWHVHRVESAPSPVEKELVACSP